MGLKGLQPAGSSSKSPEQNRKLPSHVLMGENALLHTDGRVGGPGPVGGGRGCGDF